jgi:hypothetical protein
MRVSWIAFFFYTNLFITVDALADRPIRGHYEVPTTPELKYVSRIPVKFKVDNYSEQNTRIEFPLPQELTGIPETISMQKFSENSNVWTGPKVNGECQVQERNFVCKMKFKNLNHSTIEAEKYILENYPQSELVDRLNLANRFGGEPIGILSYKMRGRDRKK